MTEKEIILRTIASFEKQEKISSIGLRFLYFVGNHYGRANATDGVFISENKDVDNNTLQAEISKLVVDGLISLHKEQHNPIEKAYQLNDKADTLYTKMSGIIQEEKDKITNERFDKLSIASKRNQCATLIIAIVSAILVGGQVYVANLEYKLNVKEMEKSEYTEELLRQELLLILKENTRYPQGSHQKTISKSSSLCSCGCK